MKFSLIKHVMLDNFFIGIINMNYILKSGYLLNLLIILFIFGLISKRKVIIYVCLILFAFLLYFFRDINYKIPNNDNQLNSPCQGTVLKVIRKDGLIHIAIFLSPLDIHVQYTPCKGKIIEQKYKEGEFNMAHLFEKSNYNERMETTIYNDMFGYVKIYQIAGLLARSIVSFYNVNDELEQNVPFGLIRLGSRVDILLNDKPNYELALKEGDKVKIGDSLVINIT